MREENHSDPFDNLDYDRTFNISSLTAAQTDQHSPPKQPFYSPRNIMNFFSKNIQEIGSPRNFFQQNLKGSQYKGKTMFRQQQIQKQFEDYLQKIQKHMEIYKNSNKNKIIDNEYKNEKQDIENEVKMSKIPVQYFQQWSQQINMTDNHNLNSKSNKNVNCNKLELLMIPPANQTYKKKSKINMRQKQDQLSEYLDQVQLIIFSKARKYPEKYINYLSNINSTDFDIDKSLRTVIMFRKVLKQKMIKAAQKHNKTIKQLNKKKNLQEILKLSQYMKSMRILKLKGKNMAALQQQSGITLKSVSHLLEQKNSLIFQLKSINKIVQNIQETHIQIKNNRIKAIKKQLQNLSIAYLTTYNRQDWLRSQLPKQVFKPEFEQKMGIETTDAMNNSVLNISVLDQSYCMGAIKSGSASQIKINSVKNIKGLQERKKKIRNQWKAYCAQYFGQFLKEQDYNFLQEQQQLLGELVLKQLLKHNGSFNRDIEDYLTLIYAQKNIIQQVPTHAQRMYYLQPKFYNKILTLYYDALKSLIYFINYCFPQLRQTHKKIMQFLKQRIDDFIKIRKINEHTTLNQVVIILNGALDYWITDSKFLAQIPEYNCQPENRHSQQQWQQFIFNKKIKITQEYLNKLHEFTLVNEIKKQIQQDNFEIVSIPSQYFLTFQFILNWGQMIEKDQQDRQKCELGLDVSLSILGDVQTSQKPRFSIFKIINKLLIIEGQKYRVTKSFFVFIQRIQSYIRVKMHFPQLTRKVDEKICEIIGFYSWYCKKTCIDKDPYKKNLKKILVFRQMCALLQKILDVLSIESVPKKKQKLQKDFQSILKDVNKEVNMFSYTMIQQQFGKLYDSRLKQRKQIPTAQSMRILDIIQKTRAASQQFDVSPKQSLANTVKAICKNYFGYLQNMEKRGKEELRWFLPKFRQCVGDVFNEELDNIEKKFAQQSKSSI